MAALFKLACWCFQILIACVVFQVIFVAMAWALAQLTDPPACTVGYAFPIPFAACPGLQLGLEVDYALAIPGAIIALPFILPGLLQSAGSEIQPYTLIPVVIYLLAVLHVARHLYAARRRA